MYSATLPVFLINIINPLWWLIDVSIKFVLGSLVLFLFESIIKKKLSICFFKKCIIKVLLFSILSNLVGGFYLIIATIICSNISYSGNETIFSMVKSGIYMAINHSDFTYPFAFLFVLSGILLSELFTFFTNYFFTFYFCNISKKRKVIICILLAFFMSPFLLFIKMSY